MGKNLITLLLASLILASTLGSFGPTARASRQPKSISSYEFVNGNWFDGRGFAKGTFYSVNGVFTFARPDRVEKTVDLQNSYVLPPFGDAHNHTLEQKFSIKSFSEKLLSDGIFYVKNPNSVARFSNQIAESINGPKLIDAVFANGGLTASGGHPSVVYDEVLAKGPFKSLKITSYNGLAYHLIDNEQDLEEKWESIVAEKPDFIKTYLLFSEEYSPRRDKDVKGFKGLNPELLPLIVEKAHESGLRVSTHVNTAFDFGAAIRAGVDEINHLPGWFSVSANDFERYTIREAYAKLAAEKAIYVVPTYSLFLNNKGKDRKLLKRAQDVQRKNLKLLQKHGVKIALGADSYFATSQREAFYLRDLGIFSNLELIKMWSVYTPETIFPDRKIAKLEPGYEASFIAMPNNPLDDFDAVKTINYRFKQGFPIEITDEPGN